MRRTASHIFLTGAFLLGLGCNRTIASTGQAANATTSTITPSAPVTKSAFFDGLTPPLLSSSDFSQESTCLSKEINYVTHTLPQQCLKTSWEAISSTETVGASGTAG